MVWILSSSIDTRLRLRTESFISTRYAQLAHRVLENLLLIAVLIVLILVEAATGSLTNCNHNPGKNIANFVTNTLEAIH